MTLSPAIGSNRYCGPAAIAIVTGCSTDEAAAAIRAVSGKAKVFSVSNVALLAALGRFDVVPTRIIVPERLSLERFAAPLPAGVYVVNVTHHYVVLDTRTNPPVACDNHTIYPLPLARYRQRHKHVKHAWRIA